MDDNETVLVETFGEAAVSRMNDIIWLQDSLSEITEDTLIELSEQIVAKGLDLHPASFFRNLTGFALVRYPKLKLYVQLLITVQSIRKETLMDYVISHLLDLRVRLLTVPEKASLAAEMMMLRVLFDMGHVTWEQILEFTDGLMAQKRKARDKVTFLFLYFMREFYETNEELARTVNHFVYRKQKRQTLYDEILDVLRKRPALAEQDWKLWRETMEFGYEAGTVAGSIVRDDVMKFQQIAASTELNFSTKRLPISLFHPLTILHDCTPGLSIIGLAGLSNAMEVLKFCLMNAELNFRHHYKTSALIISGGNKEMIRLYSDFLSTREASPDWNIADAITSHQNEIYDWLAQSAETVYSSRNALKAASVGNMHVLKSCLLSDIAQTLKSPILTVAVTSHQLDVTQLLLASNSDDLNSPDSKVTAIASTYNDTEILAALFAKTQFPKLDSDLENSYEITCDFAQAGRRGDIDALRSILTDRGSEIPDEIIDVMLASTVVLEKSKAVITEIRRGTSSPQ